MTRCDAGIMLVLIVSSLNHVERRCSGFGTDQRSYVDSFKMVFYPTIPFAVLLIVIPVCVPNMDRHIKGDVARKLQSMDAKQLEVSNKC